VDDVMASRVTIYFEYACRFYEGALREFERGLGKIMRTRLGTPLRRLGTQL